MYLYMYVKLIVVVLVVAHFSVCPNRVQLVREWLICCNSSGKDNKNRRKSVSAARWYNWECVCVYTSVVVGVSTKNCLQFYRRPTQPANARCRVNEALKWLSLRHVAAIAECGNTFFFFVISAPVTLQICPGRRRWRRRPSHLMTKLL